MWSKLLAKRFDTLFGGSSVELHLTQPCFRQISRSGYWKINADNTRSWVVKGMWELLAAAMVIELQYQEEVTTGPG